MVDRQLIKKLLNILNLIIYIHVSYKKINGHLQILVAMYTKNYKTL